MSLELVECVPNFSEGRDRAVIDAIARAIESVEGAVLKDVDPGADTHRVVVTFVAPPEAAVEAAFRAIACAAERIDMRKHRGAHPRMGATDVCPFVPVRGVTMAKCVELARRLGKRVGEELGIPVYLYEEAATRPERRSLANIRRGEYEGLAAKLAEPSWAPDFGPARMNEKSGATVIGAREFLIAYNIDLNSRSKDHATDIAFELRDKGRSARRPSASPFYGQGELVKHAAGRFICGTCLEVLPTPAALFAHSTEAHGIDYRALMGLHDQDPEGELVGLSALKPGLFKHCRAIGWEVPGYDRAQISINLTDWKVTPPHVVLEKARELAAARGLVVTGSEIVGLVPLPALVAAGRFYLERQGRSTGLPLDDVLATAVQSMGLHDVAPFSIRDKVLGYPETPKDALVARTVASFAHEVSRDSPAPGGGSVAALAGALGAALGAMVASLAIGKPGTRGVENELRAAADGAQYEMGELLAAVDADTKAFAGYLAATRLPKATPAEQAARKAAMLAGLKEAVAVPLATAERCLVVLAFVRVAAEDGLPASASDAGVGALMAHAALAGALMNVRINLGGIDDPPFVAEMRARCADLESRAKALLDETLAVVQARMA